MTAKECWNCAHKRVCKLVVQSGQDSVGWRLFPQGTLPLEVTNCPFYLQQSPTVALESLKSDINVKPGKQDDC